MLERQIDWLHEAVRTLFGFMTVPPKKKSLNLIGGRVGTRAQQDELVVDDDDAVIKWAKVHVPHLVVQTPRIDRKALRAYMEAERNLNAADATRKVPTPPGVELKKRDDLFFATPATD